MTWTSERLAKSRTTISRAFELARLDYLERKKKQALENKQKQLQQQDTKVEQSVNKSTEAHSEDI